MHLRGSRIRNSTDLEAIGISNSGPQLAHLLRNFTSKGLSGDFVIKNGELQASVFEIMHVVGNGANSVGFWRKNHGISKRLNKGDGDDDPKQRLGAVVWPGQTSEAPLGWEVAAANTRMLKIGVPTKCRASQLVDVSIDEEAGKVNKGDAVVADITMSASRAQQVDFTIRYIESGISTVVLIKELGPLTRNLWITIGATFIFTDTP
ncbi:glutamate receptor 2.7-like [Salvia splendens]|uniref:glutamate receptor 2.7-like n=1 Tax=Salvia splendens TaxID=180675 RepID=UPI001C25264B|nr:glutamate receptor 2.7-like [Salvia splendens]XP_042047574.1 glutamate receptor 2.7-like [Salvia splendens]